jgi:DNA polymerase elongation subunit (family B)
MPSKYIDGAALVYLKRNKLVAKNKKHQKKYKLKRRHTAGETVLQVDANISENTPLCGTINVKKSKSKYIVCEYIDHEKDHFILKNPIEETLFETYEFGFAFEGAFVQEPVPGLYDWIIDLDLTSMYPSNIMTLNISPETKIGRILEFNMDLFQKDLTHKFRVQIGYDLVLMNCEKLKEYLTSNKYSLASNGVFYRTDIKGLIPSILETWFAERKENSALAEKYGNEGNTSLYKYHDSLQYTLKILLNTFYGVLALPSFRFYDIENADAVTHTGRSLILYSRKIANYYYQQQFPSITESNIYADTDSVDGDSLIQTNLYGTESIKNVFAKLYNANELYIEDCTDRKFIFPNKLTLPYFNENSKTVLLGEVEYIEKHTVKKRMFKIKDNKGNNIIITEDHSLMVLNENNILEEKKPNELKINDKIVCIKK